MAAGEEPHVPAELAPSLLLDSQGAVSTPDRVNLCGGFLSPLFFIKFHPTGTFLPPKLVILAN